MYTKQTFCIAAAIIISGWTTPCASIAEINDLNVNFVPIYVGTKTQKDSDIRSEIILQLPFPLTESASTTGYGLFGGLLHIDSKTFLNVERNMVSTMGIGRVYYFSEAGKAPHSFVPFLTFYRELIIDSNESGGASNSVKKIEWLPPGFMYAYRTGEKTVLHLDAEMYSYSKTGNYRAKVGAAYKFSQQWNISLSHESLSWDINENIDSADISAQGNSEETYLKVIYSNRSKWNISLIAGHGTLHNSTVPLLPQQFTVDSNGPIFGVEVSVGALAW